VTEDSILPLNYEAMSSRVHMLLLSWHRNTFGIATISPMTVGGCAGELRYTDSTELQEKQRESPQLRANAAGAFSTPIGSPSINNVPSGATTNWGTGKG
jgi:hypothetical protein